MGPWAKALTNTDSNGKALITFNLNEFRGSDFTVGNLQNTWVHEYGKHFQDKVPGGDGEPHATAIYSQSLHSTWKETSENYKINMRNVYKEYTGRILGR